MATKKDTLSGNSNYYLELYYDLSSQDKSAKTSKIYYRLRVYKTSGSGFYASSMSSNNGWINSSLSGANDLWDDPSFAYDFRGVDYVTFDSGYFTVNHGSDGVASYSISAGINLFNLGSASVSTGTVDLPRLFDPPGEPTLTKITNVDKDSAQVYWSAPSDNGGATITEYQVGYGKQSDGAEAYETSGTDLTQNIELKYTNTTYYFWVRAKNSVGYGKWSNRLSARTDAALPPAPSFVKIDSIKQSSVVYSFKPIEGTDGADILECQVGYGEGSDSPRSFASASLSGVATVTGLTPGRTYWFWGRTRNSAGWGPWGARYSAELPAGAWVKDGGVWKRAVPYVKVAGVWQVAEAYIFNSTAKIWRKTY